MQFDWVQYRNSEAGLVDSWLNEYAIQETGIENGWKEFYDYWMAESNDLNGDDCCYMISLNNVPIAVMYIGILNTEAVISEFIVAPDSRCMGHGTAILKELLDNHIRLFNATISVAKAVIFPNNNASIKAFERAGFKLVSKHPDGDALYYEYEFEANS